MKSYNNEKIIVAFDVDGTLICHATDTPNYKVIDLYRAFEKLNCKMVIWSGCGVDYAKRWAEKLGLGGEVLPKGSISPDIGFDDMETAMAKVAVMV